MGKTIVAGLLLLDSKLNVCVTQSLETNSSEIFKKLLRAVEDFYNVKIPNLSACVDSCSTKYRNCTPKTETAEHIQEIILAYYGVQVNPNQDEARKFKHFLIDQ